MSTVLIYDPEQAVACLVSEDAGRAFGPAVNGQEGVTLLRAFLDGIPYAPDTMTEAQLWTEWQTFLAVVNEQARPPGGEPAPPDEELPGTAVPAPGTGEPAVPPGPGEDPPHDEPPAEDDPGRHAPEAPDGPLPAAPGAPDAAPTPAVPAAPPGDVPPGQSPAPPHPQPVQTGRMACPACMDASGDSQGQIGGMECPACHGDKTLPAIIAA